MTLPSTNQSSSQQNRSSFQIGRSSSVRPASPGRFSYSKRPETAIHSRIHSRCVHLETLERTRNRRAGLPFRRSVSPARLGHFAASRSTGTRLHFRPSVYRRPLLRVSVLAKGGPSTRTAPVGRHARSLRARPDTRRDCARERAAPDDYGVRGFPMKESRSATAERQFTKRSIPIRGRR